MTEKVLRIAWKSLADSRVTFRQPLFAVSGEHARAAIRKARLAAAKQQLVLVKEPARLRIEVLRLRKEIQKLGEKKDRVRDDLAKRIRRASEMAVKREKAVALRANRRIEVSRQKLQHIDDELGSARASVKAAYDLLRETRARHYALTRAVARLESRAGRLREALTLGARVSAGGVLDDPDQDEDDAAADEAAEGLYCDADGSSSTDNEKFIDIID